MRLKSIKLSGFKSFVDLTNVSFPSNLCAVVGPNGCGKSNIIDAVRWVLGESSAKNLRGESMMDVIFNGSGARKPVGQASIELVFDNTDGRIGGEFAAYNEISVRRKVTRDGQSQYFLNGANCRRKDITDMFLGTGLGPRSYAIIEQDMISRLIEARPQELRVFVEEAAGISKYKERRRDTENRISRAEENLERIKDIRDELQRQLSRLQRQANSAEKYSKYKEQERRKNLELLAIKWRDLDGAIEEKQLVVKRSDTDKERLISRRRVCDSAIEKHRVELLTIADDLDLAQEKFYKITSEVGRIEQSIDYYQTRNLERKKEFLETDENYKEALDHLKADVKKIDLCDRQVGIKQPELLEAKELEKAAVAALKEAQAASEELQTQLEEFQERSLEPKQTAEVQQSLMHYLGEIIKTLSERKLELSRQVKGFCLDAENDEISALKTSLEALSEKRLASEKARDKASQRISELQQLLKQHRGDVNGLRERHQELLGQKSSLKVLQEATRNKNQDQSWLDSKDLGRCSRLGDSLDVESGWELAVETVLGPYMQSVLVGDINSVSRLVGDFNEGELVLIEDQGRDISCHLRTDKNTYLSELVSNRYAKSLLEHVYAVDTLQEALSQRPGLKAHESVITKEGIWFGVNWLRVSGEVDTSNGIIQRKRELHSVGKKIESIENQISQAEKKVAAFEYELRNLEVLFRQKISDIDAEQIEYADLHSRLSATEMRIAQNTQSKHHADAELEEIQRNLEDESKKLTTAESVYKNASKLIERDSAEGKSLNEKRSEVFSLMNQCRLRLTKCREQREQLAMEVNLLDAQRSTISEGTSRLESQVDRLASRLQELKKGDDEDLYKKYQNDLERMLAERLSAEKQLKTVRKMFEDLEYQKHGQEKERNVIDSDIALNGSELESHRLALRELTTRRDALEEQFANHEADLPELLGAVGDNYDLNAKEVELQLIQDRIQRLGPINLAAIQEYELESERREYLDKQNEELEEALETLKTAIKKIDRETRSRFKDTFDLLNMNIRDLFPKLFGGGEAYLEIIDDDLLNTGVMIRARPPGKKNASIHMLSGGEKALTAIAMVFAIFKLNPAPFCMLDEVDAALDDLNVARYAEVVREMSDQVQFIIVTHNKTTMQATNQLVGVTMMEAGVSKIVSVDVNAAVKLSAST